MPQANYVQDAGAIDHTPGSDVAAGDVVLLGNGVGIAKRAISSGVLGTLHTEGVFDIAAVTDAMTDDNRIYWDPDGDPVGGTAGTGAATESQLGVYLGRAIGDKAAAGTTVRVQLVGEPAESVMHGIDDPGDAAAIPVTNSGHVDIVTGAGGETNTLDAPTFNGQMLQLNLKTDGGGDRVITCATTVDQVGNNTITLGAAGDSVVLVGKTNGANKRWSVAIDDGAASLLSTV